MGIGMGMGMGMYMDGGDGIYSGMGMGMDGGHGIYSLYTYKAWKRSSQESTLRSSLTLSHVFSSLRMKKFNETTPPGYCDWCLIFLNENCWYLIFLNEIYDDSWTPGGERFRICSPLGLLYPNLDFALIIIVASISLQISI